MTTEQSVSGTTQVTVDRVSNSGNLIAQETVNGQTIQVPAGAVGDTYEVRLIDRGGYFEAELIDRATETRPRSPSIGATGNEVDLAKGRTHNPHEFEIRNSPRHGNLRGAPNGEEGRKRRKWMARRKM